MKAIINRKLLFSVFLVFGLYGCANLSKPHIPTSSESVSPGTSVTRAGVAKELIGSPVSVGDKLPNVMLMDKLMRPHTLDEFRGKTILLSIAPSLDTQVCERQTHLLADASEKDLPPDIARVVVTRDLPFAHARFAEHTDFHHLTYLSDYRTADFGQQTGLLIDDLRLLARTVMVLDKNGVIRYMQVVPEVGHLPDMEKAFAIAREIDTED